ncbi:MAG TPA: ABC transporter ATP-binding protein [Candidatus Thermoplasmatota archaeon]|jgi:ABC-2 type transport system ATP-binding protein|nr:ABC transporter ATP-binding protein [Candidatus Thermoplasmatota archaeon]
MAVIACKGLSKWYGDVIAVNDITVDLQPGVTGLLGPNGAGKSSLIRMAVGLQQPSAGSILVLDENPWDHPRLLARIGYVPEGDAPWRDRTGHRAAVLAARLSGLSGEAAEQAAERALKQVGLDAQRDKVVGAYSRGMRQKLKLGLALLHDPELLILDEPLLGSDPTSRRDLIHLIQDIAKQGKSALVSTHVLPDVEAMTQRILLLNHGRLMAHGEVREIRDLLERYPRTVRVATSQPRELGALLWSWPSVLSIQCEEGAVIVRTKQPQAFFEALQGLLVQKDTPFASITSLDEDVEAIFRYLVG